MLDHLLRHRARAHDERRVAFQVAVDAFRELYTRQRHRRGPRAYLGLCAHALPYFKRSLKHTVQDRSRKTLLEGLAVSGLDLAQNLRFTEHHRVESRRHAEEVPHRVLARPTICAAREIRARY